MHLQLNEDVSILFACLFACCGGNRVDIVHKAQHERAERKKNALYRFFYISSFSVCVVFC